MEEKELANIARFVFELGQLKRTPRSGWFKLGVNNPESVAEHSFRTAVLGFLLGKMEDENPHRVAGYCLFHDMAETRTSDLDWLAQEYVNKEDYISSEIITNQTDNLPDELKAPLEELLASTEETDHLKRVARDADLLDLMFHAAEIAHQGNPLAQEWFENTLPSLTTKSGKKIGKFLKKRDRNGTLKELLTWWKEAKPNQNQDNP